MSNLSHITVEQSNQIMQSFASKADNRFLKISDVDEYTLTKAATAEAGMLATYQLFKGTTAVGDKINIPKDFLVKSATLETCATADVPVAGYVVGDKYIDFVVNTVDSSEAASHLYLLVSDLVDTYTEGNGINIVNNAVSVKVSTTGANGLSVSADGLALATASATTTGALSSTDFATFNGKQDALTAGTGIDSSSLAEGTLNVVGDLTAYTGTGAITVSDHVVSVAAATASVSGVGGNAGTISAADQEKLNGITTATAADIQGIIDAIWPAEGE